MTRRALAVLVGVGLTGAAALAVIVVLVFGAANAPAPEQLGTDAGYAFDPIGTEPAAVAVAVMSGVFTWQPAVQDSTWEALHSQQDHLTGPMATAAAQPPTPAPNPLPEWAAWSRSGDVVTAVVRLNGDPTIDADTATVPVTISQTVQHSDGDTTSYTHYAANVTLAQQSGAWKVSNYQLDNNDS